MLIVRSVMADFFCSFALLLNNLIHCQIGNTSLIVYNRTIAETLSQTGWNIHVYVIGPNFLFKYHSRRVCISVLAIRRPRWLTSIFSFCFIANKEAHELLPIPPSSDQKQHKIQAREPLVEM